MKTDSQLLVDAVRLLKPNSEFVIRDNDYSSIEWHILEGEAPTQVEIDEAIEQVKADDAKAELDRATKKAAAQAKLAALGLSLDDLAALGL